MKHAISARAWGMVLALLVLILVACGPAPAAEDAAETPGVEIVESQANEAPVVNESSGGAVVEATTGELQYVEVEAGDGPQPVAGDRVQVHYTGKLEDGTVFDSSLDRGTPFEFVLGQGQVISGWDQGIAMMREGGKATLIIPPNLAYGAAGAGDTIPPNATLTFEVELVSVLKPPKPVVVAQEDYESLLSGIQYYDIEGGEGDIVEDGDRIAVHFAVWILDGDFLVDSRDRGIPAIYTLGTNELFLNEWDDGVLGMRIGGLRQLVIPPEAVGANAPPGQTLVLELEPERIVDPIQRAEVDETAYTSTESGLKYYDIVEGDGDQAEAGSTVTIHYTGWLPDSEIQFESSVERGDPVEFPLGAGAVIPGWEEGIAGMRAGGRRQLLIPPELGFGDSGGGRVPPNSPLIFEVELLAVNAGQ